MKRFMLSVVLVLVAVAIPVSAVYGAAREEIRLTTIIPDQQVLRVKKGVIGETWKYAATTPSASIPESGLLVEGNVGIGTTNPSYSLDVDGHIRINHGSSLLLTNPTAENHIYLRNTGVGAQRSLSINYTSAGTPAFSIDPWGKIGIGTTTPSAQLDILAGNKNMKLLSFSEDDVQFKSFYVKSLFDPALSGGPNKIVFCRDFVGLPDLDILTLKDDGADALT